MRKTFSLITIIFVIAFSYAQETDTTLRKDNFKIGANGGLTTTSEFSSTYGFDIAYLRKVGKKIDVGAATGYSNYSTDGSYINIHFVPLAATAQYSVLKKWYVGLDLGVGYYQSDYAYISKYGTGYLFVPKLGFQTNRFEFYIAYKKVYIPNNNIDMDARYFNIGFNFKIFKTED